MPSIDPKDLDRSPAMMEFFRTVVKLLVERYEKKLDDAETMVQRLFAWDVTSLERALAMHRGAERLAEEFVLHPIDKPR